MKLRLRDVEAECVIGERPDERTRLQTLHVDVEMELADRVSESDSLADTVDYAALVETIRSSLVAAKCRLIERAARVVVDACLAEKAVRSVRVAVRKSGAIAHLAAAEAVYESGR